MKTKSFPARVKAAGSGDGLGDGQFEALVSVFGNVDSAGDVVMPGAFKDTLDTWAAKGDPIPVLWAHDWGDPFSHIGVVLAAEERDEGLWVRGELDLDSPKAVQVNRLLKSRRVTQFSFAYDVLDAGYGKRDDVDVYELRKLHIFEVGPTLVGMNQETELLAAKSIGDLFTRVSNTFKSGRVLSSKNEIALRGALDKIAEGMADVESVLSVLDVDDNGKAKVNPADEAASAKSAAMSQPAHTPATVRLLADLIHIG